MVLIFTKTTTSLAAEFVETFPLDKLSLHLFRVAKETGVEFKQHRRTYSIIGQWRSVIAAHEQLEVILQNPSKDDTETIINDTDDIAESNKTQSRILPGDLESKRGRKAGHTLKVSRPNIPKPLVYIKFESQQSEEHEQLDKQVCVSSGDEDVKDSGNDDAKVAWIKKEKIDEKEDVSYDGDTDIEEQYIASPKGDVLDHGVSVEDNDQSVDSELVEHGEGVDRKRRLIRKSKSVKPVSQKGKTKGSQQNGFQCEHCPYIGAKRSNLKDHMKRHKPKLACEICNKEFCKKDLKNHIKRVHEKIKSKPGNSVKKEKPTEYHCKDCSYIGKKQANLTEHMKRMHRQKYQCEVCEKQFGIRKDLKRHTTQVHCQPQHFCKDCGASYKCKRMFQNHMKTHEEGYVKPAFGCKICDKSFSTEYVLASHIKSEHLGMKKSYLCPICGQSFTQRGTYVTHANVHAGIKPYVCDICGKAFTYEKAMKQHRYVHDDIKRYECDVCHKGFRQSSSLYIHMKIHRDNKDYMCTACGKGFTQKHALLRHERIHSGAKPFSCSLCNKAFNDYSIIRRHLLLIHKSDPKKWREHVVSSVRPDKAYRILTRGDINKQGEDNSPPMIETGQEVHVDDTQHESILEPSTSISVLSDDPSNKTLNLHLQSLPMSVNDHVTSSTGMCETAHMNPIHFTSSVLDTDALLSNSAERPRLEECVSHEPSVGTNPVLRWGYAGYPAYYPYEH